MATPAKSFEDLLIARTGVPSDVVARARERQRDGKSLTDALRELGALDGPAWARTLAAAYDLPFSEHLAAGEVDLELLAQLPMQYARRNAILPLRREGDDVIVAISDPRALGPLDDLRVLYGGRSQPLVVPAEALTDAINRAYDLASGSAAEFMDDLDEERLDLIADRARGAAGPPRCRRRGADHPARQLAALPRGEGARQRHPHRAVREGRSCVRFRIDGMLHDVIAPPKRVPGRRSSRA